MDKSVEGLKEWAKAHIRWFGQSAFRLRMDSGDLVFFDPFRVPSREGPARLVLVTHPHQDHYDRGAIEGLRGPGTTVLLPRGSAETGQAALSAGESTEIGPFRVTAVAAYNRTRRFHPQNRGWLGYLLETGGVRIYHAGDTDLIPEMEGLAPDIALMPVGGLFSMNVSAAVEAAEKTGAALCIPMHYGMLLGGRKAGARFVERVGARGLELPRA
jgi:L-ascorbate metabolism protein UlaG (beta-lactamase superfamily)